MNEQKKSGYAKVIHFFDRFEDHVRANLSHRPIIYSFVGGVAIVLFWRGVWMTADDYFPVLNGPISILVSLMILLATGLFVSFFVGDRILLSGINREKKLVEKTEEEIKTEMTTLSEVKRELKHIEEKLEHIEEIENKR